MSEPAKKDLIAFSIVGHVDSGKSTLTGTLAMRFGGLDNRQMQKLTADAEARNKGSFAKAFFTDRTEEEKNRGVTIQTTLVPMETEKYRLTVIDCPGHADYIKNATSGCKQADVSIVVCPARFEASCSAEGTLKTHITLSAILGNKKFILAINKLDDVAEINENSQETAFDAACAAVIQIFKKVGVKEEDVICLPISALKEVGIFKGGETYKFHKGASVKEKNGVSKIFTIEEAIDYQDPPARALDKNLRMPVSSIAHVPGHGTVLCGRVDYGVLKKGDGVKVLPIGLEASVKSIEAYKQSVPEATAGMNVGFVLDTKQKETIASIKAGSVVGHAKDADFNTYTFYKVSAISMLKGGKSADGKGGIKVGYSPVISCGSTSVACKFAKLLKIIYKDKTEQVDPEKIPHGGRFEAIIYPTKTCVFETAKEFPGLGKFVCRDQNTLGLCGHIIEKISLKEGQEKYGLDVALLSGDKEALKKARENKKNA